eukprot:TRINITY_DN3747_c0_g2_i1.p1 TRINITY_DN3747_c0_g2~~TRINITY_DN3747_c0_g2_i1.p1  ORF type:complete len:858 (+),score=278.23 TRINITY_DN3747_c0_g2_i1:87-2576(+)
MTLRLAVALLLAAAGAPAGARRRRGAKQGASVGIDWGSEVLRVAVTGRDPPRIVLNSMSERRFPALAGFHQGERLLCESAAALAATRPESVARCLRAALAATSLDADGVAQDAQLLRNDSERGGLRYSFPGAAGDGEFATEEAAAMVLQHAASFAADADHLQGAAVTVFPGAGVRQRLAAGDAAQLAGLPLASVIGEHAAAAVAYSAVHDYAAGKAAPSKGKVVFISVGAAGTWAALAQYRLVRGKAAVSGGRLPLLRSIQVKGLEWDDKVGARVFQERLTNELAAEFDRSGGCKEAAKSCSVSRRYRPMARLRVASVRAAEVLTSRGEAEVVIEQLHDGRDLRSSVTRARYEEITSDLVEAAAAPLRRLLALAGRGGVGAAELVGGGTRTPAVQRALQEVLGKTPLSHRLDKDEAVALGAAACAANLSARGHAAYTGVHPLLQDALPYALWLTVTDSDGTAIYQGQLLRRLHALPARPTRVLPNSTADEFTVTLRSGSGPAAPAAAMWRVTGARGGARKAVRQAGAKGSPPEQWALSLRFSVGFDALPLLPRAQAVVAVERVVEIKAKKDKKGKVKQPAQSKLVRDSVESEPLATEPLPLDSPRPLTAAERQAAARRLQLLRVADERRTSIAAARNELQEAAIAARDALRDYAPACYGDECTEGGCAAAEGGEGCADHPGEVAALAAEAAGAERWLLTAEAAEADDEAPFMSRLLALRRAEKAARPLFAAAAAEEAPEEAEEGGDGGGEGGGDIGGGNSAEASGGDCCAEAAALRREVAELRAEVARLRPSATVQLREEPEGGGADSDAAAAAAAEVDADADADTGDD